MELPKLNFPPGRFRVRGEDIWDDQRGKWVKLTPEEWVRRHVVRWLTQERGVAPQLIVQEYPVEVQGMSLRADVVVFDEGVRPELLVECKAPGVRLDEEVLEQAMRYNGVVGARRVMITNGLEHRIYDYE